MVEYILACLWQARYLFHSIIAQWARVCLHYLIFTIDYQMQGRMSSNRLGLKLISIFLIDLDGFIIFQVDNLLGVVGVIKTHIIAYLKAVVIEQWCLWNTLLDLHVTDHPRCWTYHVGRATQWPRWTTVLYLRFGFILLLCTVI